MNMIYNNSQLIPQWTVWYCMLQKNMQNYDLKIVNRRVALNKSITVHKKTLIHDRGNC